MACWLKCIRKIEQSLESFQNEIFVIHLFNENNYLKIRVKCKNMNKSSKQVKK